MTGAKNRSTFRKSGLCASVFL